MTISERIFKILKERGMTQKEFSDRTGIRQSTISDWKHKKVNPTSDKLMIICEVLGISPSDLLSDAMSSNYEQIDYIVVDKNSREYQLVKEYRKLGEADQRYLQGYLEAMTHNLNKQ